ncbi:methyltransferase domain-containing protein [Oxalobacteraceae bacterium CAVE-383]|nr:methyltransferase domain-containing protein [Oxalobacteraceae bacterium CAVE-383]
MSSSAVPPDTNLSAPIDLSLVRRLFARPQRLSESLFLRREIAARMHERLALINLAPRHVLDAGCGEGADLFTLQDRFGGAQVLGLDGSPAMLALAQQRIAAGQPLVSKLLTRWLPIVNQAARAGEAELIAGDFAALPFGPNALDMIWSNLALQWHPQPDKVFAEWRRVTRVGGLAMFSSFGPDTLKELNAAFAEIDLAPHVLPFVDMHDLGDMLVNAGFSTPVMDMETITVTYTSPEKLLAEVRALGGNPLYTRRRGLLGRRAHARLIERLMAQRGADGRIALTYEVVFGHAFKPQPKTTDSGEAIIRFEPKRR